VEKFAWLENNPYICSKVMNVEDKNHVDDLSCIYNFFDGIGMLFVVYQDIERPTEGEC
jgi:hypothetical protein